MKQQTGGIDPKTLDPIRYCRLHAHYINLAPHVMDGKSQGFRVVCGDCTAFGPWKKTPQKAIEAWNEKYGACKE